MFTLTQVRPNIFSKILTFTASLALLLLCANFKIFLPSLSPVPITMHTFAILVLGSLLPFRQAFACFMIFLVEGLVGSPVFGGPIFIGASFGYLVGMPVALYFLNQATKKMPLLPALIIADVLILVFGVLHLQFLVGLKTALVVGVLPFIIGNAFKISAAYLLIERTMKKRNQLNAPSI